MMATANSHAKPERWKVHLGAHKTATTHVQRVLDSIAGDLRAQGIALLPQAIGRPAFRAAVRPHAGLRGIRQALDMRRRHLPAIRDSVAGA
ncbi:MAG: hypothetical protein Q4G49_09340, partial [Paracoccus sp. (in: a-proteobacteria)]|nr:hypothetical protein [Paracoccus sp. (in: a-proteobacteria)]